jgi:hypothetical protein
MKAKKNQICFLRLYILILMLSIYIFSYAYTENQTLRNDAAPNQAYGFSVDISGNRALVGAYGDTDPNNQLSNGSAYFHTWNGSSWTQSQKLYYPAENMPEALSDIGFGYKVIIKDTIAFVSAPWDFSGNAITGSVYYYHYNGTQWIFRQKIAPSVPDFFGDFGLSMDYNGSRLIVGAPGTDHVLNTNVPTEMNYGSAYVFKWNGTAFIEEQILLGSDTNCFDSFGDRVTINGNTIVVTAFEAGPFNPNDIHQAGTGKAYVYNLNGNVWTQSQIIVPSDGQNGNWFGRSVKLNNDFLVIGSPKNETSSSIMGSVYCYNYSNNQWNFSQKIIPTLVPNTNIYGISVDIENNRMVVGAAFWTYAANGSAYVYDFNGTQWVQNHVLNHSDPSESGDDFGYSVAIDNERIIGGAPWKNGWAGSAYVYHYENMAPIANAGVDQDVQQNILVTLNGSASHDPENSTLTYSWTAPQGITLSSNTIVNPTFTSPVSNLAYQDFLFVLTVNDGNSNSLPDTVKIRVLNDNLMPVANAGEDKSALENTVCNLNGSASHDPEGFPVTYQWTAPTGIQLSDPASANPFFTCPNVSENTDLIFSLIVNDGTFNSEPDYIRVRVLPVLPVQNLHQETGTLNFSWIPPAAVEKTFRYDDNNATDALGANNSTAMLGAAYNENSILDQVSWLLSDQSGAHPTVNIYILGLNTDGTPNQENILASFPNTPNTDNQWNFLELDQPVSTPNGFFIGLNYEGFLGLSIDDGVGAPYAFINGTHFASVNWQTGDWTTL